MYLIIFLIEKFGYIKFIQYLCKRKQETNTLRL